MASYCCLSVFEISYYHNHVLFLEMWMATLHRTVNGSVFRCSFCLLDNLGCIWSILAKQLMKFLSLIQPFPSPVFWKLLLTCCVCSKFRRKKKKTNSKSPTLWSHLIMFMAQTHSWSSAAMGWLIQSWSGNDWLVSLSLLRRMKGQMIRSCCREENYLFIKV